MVRNWDQEVCSLCGLRFESCGCSYDGHWRFTWSLTSGPVGLVEVRASWRSGSGPLVNPCKKRTFCCWKICRSSYA